MPIPLLILRVELLAVLAVFRCARCDFKRSDRCSSLFAFLLGVLTCYTVPCCAQISSILRIAVSEVVLLCHTVREPSPLPEEAKFIIVL